LDVVRWSESEDDNDVDVECDRLFVVVFPLSNVTVDCGDAEADNSAELVDENEFLVCVWRATKVKDVVTAADTVDVSEEVRLGVTDVVNASLAAPVRDLESLGVQVAPRVAERVHVAVIKGEGEPVRECAGDTVPMTDTVSVHVCVALL
jgi:hypothetical protein